MLVAAEFAPRCVEFARHSEIFLIKCLRISDNEWEIIVSPTARWKRFYFIMRAHRRDISLSSRCGTCIIEYRNSGLDRLRNLAHPPSKFKEHLFAESQHRGVVGYVVSLCLHSPNAIVAKAALLRNNDIEKESVGIIALADLFDLQEKRVEIFRVKAERVVYRGKESAVLSRRSVALTDHVLGMANGILFVKSRRNIYRCFNTDLVRRIYLRPQKIELEIRVHLVRLGGMIRPTVMAF